MTDEQRQRLETAIRAYAALSSNGVKSAYHPPGVVRAKWLAVARILDEIQTGRRRPELSAEEKAKRYPRPPEELVGALQDRITPTSGRLLSSKPIKRPKETT